MDLRHRQQPPHRGGRRFGHAGQADSSTPSWERGPTVVRDGAAMKSTTATRLIETGLREHAPQQAEAAAAVAPDIRADPY